MRFIFILQFILIFEYVLLIAEDTWGFTWVDGDNGDDTPVTSAGPTGSGASTPGGRMNAAFWYHENEIYLFGGTNGKLMNDFWKKTMPSSSTGTVTPNMWLHLSGEHDTLEAWVNTYPSSRYGASHCKHHSSGKFVMFGGYGVGPTTSDVGLLRDYWEYDPSTTTWTNVDDNSETGAVDKETLVNDACGDCSLEAPSGTPRYEACDSPQQAHIRSRYNLVDSSRDPCGSKDFPAGRMGAGMWCLGGDVYMFGGFAVESETKTRGQPEFYGDPLRYTARADMWTITSGIATLKSDDTTNHPPMLFMRDTQSSKGQYGTMDSNHPGNRAFPLTWLVVNLLYLFGGIRTDLYDTVTHYNDLWVYDRTKSTDGQFAWIHKGGNEGSYQDKGNYSTKSFPAVRSSGIHFLYTDATDNNFWFMWSGNGIEGHLNDMWSYNYDNGQWKLHYGHSSSNENTTFISGFYGVKNDYRPLNNPPARHGAVYFAHKPDTAKPKLFIFGGWSPETNSYKSDMWEMQDLSALEEYECYGLSRFHEDVCNGNGACMENGKCECDAAFDDGKDCATAPTPGPDTLPFTILMILSGIWSIMNVFVVLLIIIIAVIVIYLGVSGKLKRDPAGKGIDLDVELGEDDELSGKKKSKKSKKDKEDDDEDNTDGIEFKTFAAAPEYEDEDEEDDKNDESDDDDDF